MAVGWTILLNPRRSEPPSHWRGVFVVALVEEEVAAEKTTKLFDMSLMAERWRKGVFFMPTMVCGREATDREVVSRDGSHYSLSSGILPSLGARSNRRVKLRKFIISPYDRRYRGWETFLIILVIYSAWVSPFEFGFIRNPTGGLALADNIVNGFFAIDIILTFFVAYLDRATYLHHNSPKQIAWKIYKELVYSI
ncbi:Potassium channel AKT1 [Ananas comosus]|uniref:Potassium channel AKT1 n=1 Tax=Ananas comosus TaxID=4615 RepID=A0A199V9H0_ANACO|nr:Potassium channel AKT1 [Ananas comosus]